MIADGSLDGGMRLKVIEGLKLQDHGVHDAVITTPANLLLELFTDGVGTIIRADERGPIHIPPRPR
jgi:acetylglutamate kinase